MQPCDTPRLSRRLDKGRQAGRIEPLANRFGQFTKGIVKKDIYANENVSLTGRKHKNYASFISSSDRQSTATSHLLPHPKRKKLPPKQATAFFLTIPDSQPREQNPTKNFRTGQKIRHPPETPFSI